jgi:NAD-dependent SIR2 family protein deacetylase
MTKNYGKFRLWNREMTRMRVLARNAPPGRCHTYIAQLYDAQRLLRCYTQNIDGLQTRDRADMANHVLEMRGTNAELACHLCKRRPPRPAQSFDEIIFRDGFAICPFCQKESESRDSIVAQYPMVKWRARPPYKILTRTLSEAHRMPYTRYHH